MAITVALGLENVVCVRTWKIGVGSSVFGTGTYLCHTKVGMRSTVEQLRKD